MKKLFFCLFTIALASSALAQDFTYSIGLKGGINYSMGGNLEGEATETGEMNQWDAQSKIGFHGGGFVQANLGRLFLRPELIYTSISTEYEFPNSNTTHSVTKIDFPVLLGYNIFGPLDIYAGPVYSNIIGSDIETGPGETFRVVVQESPGINLNVGAKLDFGRIGIDLRYERTLSPAEDLITEPVFDVRNPEDSSLEPESDYGVGQTSFSDPRINQIILSVTFKIFGNDIQNSGNRRGRKDWCY